MKHSLKRFASLSLAVVLTMQVFSVAPLQVAAVDSQGIQELYKGLTYEAQSFENTDDANVNAFVITVDTAANQNLAFVAGSPNDEQPLKEGLQQTTSDQAKAAALNGRNVLAAVNADFFNINDSDKIQPTGLMIQDGVELTPYYQFTGPDDPEHGVRLFFGVTDDGEAMIGDENTYEERKDELYQAVGGRYLLVDEGKAQTYDGDISFETERAPRTAVGIREDGSVLLVVIDGRNSGGSAGTTLVETADYMVELGAETALNLDGGGSSTAVIKNPETRNYEVKNVPSDGKERPVGNTLLVIDTSEESTSVDLEQDTDGYYLLTAPEDFREILDGPSENYRLANDVDFSDMENFTIGMFDGTFDGDGYTIENLTAADVGSGYALFDSITSNAEIKDLKLEDVSIENPDTSYTAALVGNCSGTVRNVTVTGSIEGSTDVGSIAATLQRSGRIVGCSVGVAVTGDSHVGGIVGRMYEQTTVDGCYANVRMQGGSQVAAVCGYGSGYVAGSESYIQNCVVTGSITATGIEPGGIGGLAKLGINHCIVTDLDITVLNAEAPNAGNATGFLAVWTNGGVPDTQNVILSGNITTDPNNGTVAHRISYHANDKSYNYAGPDALINGEQETGGAHDNQIGADVSKEELQTLDFWEGLDYDFSSTFSWDEEQKMPMLQSADYTVTAPSLEDEMTLEKDEDGYYLIRTAEEFAQINQLPTGKFRLGNDLVLDGVELEPISYFSGELDGQGNTIHGLKVDADGSSYALVETLTSGGLIHDLQLENVQIRNGAGSYTAAVVGLCSGTVRNVTVTGKIYGTNMVGAVAGNVLGTGKLERCSAGALVSGNAKVGGLAGQVTGTVDACYVNCHVTGVDNVGGVTGYALDNAGGTRLIQNCIVEGSVSCSGVEAGGIAGLAKATIQNNIVRNMTASSTGKGEPGSGNVAGLLGAWVQNLPAELSIANNVVLSGSVSAPSPAEGYRLGKSNKPDQVHDNYANSEILVNGETVVGASNDGNGQDLTDEQMQSKDFFAGLGFNFETVFSWDESSKTVSLQNVNQQVEAPAPGPVEGEELQESLALSVGTDETEVNLTWYSDSEKAGTVRWAKQSEVQNGQLPESAGQVTASVRQANKSGFYSNQATISGLEADTVYAYQLINGGKESGLYTLTTGTADGSFSFALAGDPQIGASGNAGNDANGWEKTLGIVADDPSFENVDFLLSAGDQVNTASDESQYTGYLEHGELAELPVATVIGNHDSSSDAYGEHFNVPNEDATLGQTTAGGDYYFVYDNTLFMVLNSNNMSTAEHKSFMQKAIEETADQDIQWKVVTFHHSIYSMASHVNDSDIIERRNQLPQVFKELDIDVVLMGHDHVYTRTYMMDGPNPILESDKYTDTDGDKIPEAVTDPDGILYVTVNSASGSKFYDLQENTGYQWAAVINQEKVPNISRVDVTDNSFTITTYRTSDLSVVDTFTINRTSAEPAKQIEAFENGNSSLNLTAIARYDSGMTNADGGVMEIVDYNAETGYAYAINGQAGTLAAISLADLEKGETIQQLEGNTVDVKRLVQVDGFTYGDMTSVAISPDGTTLAAAVQAAGYADNGRVVLFACGADGTLTFQQAIETGVQPDMVTFTPDGSKILTANEGEPREGYTATDPQGSVTVIEVKTLQAQTIGFETYDAAEARQALTDAGVLLKKETNPSVDFEPEYIAATDTMAYVTLQEANAIAVLDLGSLAFTGVYSAGFEDYSKTPVDIDKKDGAYAPKTYEGLLGIRMPDAISLYEADGKTYLLTANEGDAREWGDYLNEAEVNFGKEGARSPAGNLTQDSGLSGKVVFFKTEDFDGLQNGKDYLFGGRSFTLYQVNADGLTEVFTSADDFESRTAEYLGDYFNCSNDNLDLDDRSGKKGPEPETVTVGEVDGKTYAFITLERIGGVMVYDITDPQDMSYVNYINSRDFSKELGADDSPEGLKFIPASQSPTEEALLVAACEVGGTVAVYELTEGKKDNGGSHSSGSGSGGSRPPVQTEEPFADVQMDDWFYNAVVYVVKNGLMNGVTNTQFSPDTATTRGMIVTILYRMAGKPTADGTSFADVEQDAYYADAVAWAAESGIVMGYGDGTFGPNDSITREQMATMLYRYAGSPAVTQTALQFADSGEVSSYATNAISWAVQQGILSGKTGNILDPQGDATRAQVAQMLQNYLQ